jgi:hypothetical protein
MWDSVPRVISIAAELPAMDNLSFVLLATFVTVSLLAWLSGFDDPRTPTGTGFRR